MRKKIQAMISLVVVGLLLAACVPKVSVAETPTSEIPSLLTVMTHDSFAVSEEVIRAFEQENNLKVEFLKSGDTGSALNRAILTKASPQADVFYGVDNTFLSRALEAELFIPYDSPALQDIPDDFKLDKQNRALPVDFGDVCLNYDKVYFANANLAVPQSFEDLLKPEYKGLLVVQNPATSSPGLSFMLATVARYGANGFLDFWRALRDNEVVVVNDWETAYYTNFSGSSGKGAQPIVVSYNSSPAAEVIFAPEPLEDSPTAAITSPGMCFRQIEFVGILNGTRKQVLAQKFVDFMLSLPFQNDMPLQMFVYPVRNTATLPPEFVKYSAVPDQPASIDPELISQNREAWITAWNEVMLR